MAARKIAIDIAPGRTNNRIELDGQPLHGVRGLTIDATAATMPKVTLDLIVHAAEFNGEALVLVPDKTRQTLLALGWTPPAELAPGEGRRA